MELLSLTLSPPAGGNPVYNYEQQRPWIQRMLNRCSKTYFMIPELDDSGRLHWHGWVYVHDHHKWFIQVIPTLFHNVGFINSKKIHNFEQWEEYIMKDIERTRTVFSEEEYPLEKLAVMYVAKLPRAKRSELAKERDIRTLENYGFTFS